MLALGDCGVMKLLSAITAATLKATVVKKPKTFCSRTSAECMIVEVVDGKRDIDEVSTTGPASICDGLGVSCRRGELLVGWS
jgi:hypothetical protein